MRLNDKALTFVTGLVLLLGVGTFVHMGEELFAPKGETTQLAKADTGFPIKTDAGPTIPQQTARLETTTSNIVLASNDQAASIQADQTTDGTVKIDPVQLDCDVSLSAFSLKGARVRLEVVAPCHKNKVVSIEHAGLRFNEITDGKGMVAVIIPVLADTANIEVSFADGVSKSISAPAKDLS